MDAGAIAIVVVMVLVLPPALMFGGMAFGAVLGWLLKSDAETRHEGEEAIDLNY
jgi:hypothetical protein